MSQTDLPLSTSSSVVMVGIYIVLTQIACVSGDAFENFGDPLRLKTDSTDFVMFYQVTGCQIRLPPASF